MRAYLSHAIRGRKGSRATRQDMEENNRIAIEFARMVQLEFPKLDLYVPAEHDEFVLIAYECGYVNEEQILGVDKRILDLRDFLIVYSPDGFLSYGMSVELSHAKLRDIPVVMTDGDVTPIRQLLETLI